MQRSVPRQSLILALLFALTAAPLLALTRPDLPSDAISRIDAHIARKMEEHRIPGLSLAIAMDNRPTYAKGFGLADVENNVPVRTTTRFRTASIAKPMTATAVMQLAERGRIDLESPVQKYCPEFPNKPWPVTIRQLLGHLGGVRHYQRPGEPNGTEHFFTIKSTLKIFKDDPLLHEPGTKYGYTTYGYSLLGCAVEGASGREFETYMHDHVFKPAAMDRTRVDNHFEVVEDRARGYSRLSESDYNRLPPSLKARAKPGQWLNANLHDTSMKVPGGGLLSTPTDLVKFALAAGAGSLVKKETLAQMWTEQKLPDGKGTGYGLGWGVGTGSRGRVVTHSGGQAGTSCVLFVLPEKGVAIAVMTNVEGLGRGLGEIITGILDVIVPQ